jgi:hypothetical protein
MAKYKLTVTHYLEDNEGTQSESELQKYLDDCIATSISDWDKVQATLVANDTSVFHSETSKNNESQKKHGWPWHRSTDCLPTDEDKHILACVWDGERWREFSNYEWNNRGQYFYNDYGKLYPDKNVYWRTVAEPEPPMQPART